MRHRVDYDQSQSPMLTMIYLCSNVMVGVPFSSCTFLDIINENILINVTRVVINTVIVPTKKLVLSEIKGNYNMWKILADCFNEITMSEEWSCTIVSIFQCQLRYVAKPC